MEKCPDEMDFFNSFVDKGLVDRLNHVANSDFGRITYTEAIDILEKSRPQVRLPRFLGLRPADRARTVS